MSWLFLFIEKQQNIMQNKDMTYRNGGWTNPSAKYELDRFPK